MTVGQQGPGSDGRVSPDDGGAPTERVRASSETPLTAAVQENEAQANITAELPPVAPRRQSTAEVRSAPLPSPKPERLRDPAPTALRMVVWFLFFVLLFTLAGLVTVRLHPDWLSFLRNEQPSSTPVFTPPVTTAPQPTAKTISLISTSASTVAYGVPASSFSLVVQTLPTARSWTEVQSPLNSKTLLFAAVIPPNSSRTIALHGGSGSVVVDATVKSLTVVSGSETLGRLTPKLGVVYEFTSTSS